jgi:hypothetical protein
VRRPSTASSSDIDGDGIVERASRRIVTPASRIGVEPHGFARWGNLGRGESMRPVDSFKRAFGFGGLEDWEARLVEAVFDEPTYRALRPAHRQKLAKLHAGFAQSLGDLQALIEVLTQDDASRTAEVLAQFSPDELRALADASGGRIR